MIAQANNKRGTLGKALFVGIGALALSLILSAADAHSSFKTSPPNIHPLAIHTSSLPPAAFVDQYWHTRYHDTAMVRLPQEVANEYSTSPTTTAPYALVIDVGDNPEYITTPEEYHPYVSQIQAHKWRAQVHIDTTQSMGQTGWTTWTITRNRVSTHLAASQAEADPFLSPLEVQGLRHSQFTTESIQANRPDRLGVIAEVIGSQIGPHKINQFIRSIQGLEH